MYIVGIDIAKKSHQAAIMNKNGSLLGKSFRFPNTREGFEFFMSKITAVDTDLRNFEFGMEATGHYWLNLYTWLAEKQVIIHVINPLQSDALRNLYLRKTKTDSVDAKIIAQVIRIGQYSETKLADDTMLSMRDLCRQRFFLVDIMADLKRKIIVMMDRIFPEYQGVFSDTFGKSSAEILRNCTTPEEIVSMGVENLTELLRTASNGKFRREKAIELTNLAENSFAARLSSQTLSLLVKQMMEQISLVERQTAVLEELIAGKFRSFDTKITQIPGIGPVLGASILSEIGDINRFASPKKLVAYAGIDPSVIQSGQFTGTDQGYILVGPGRWGSSDTWLGIPVKWPHICNARVIVECGLENYRIDPSQGTHFFQNLTSFGVGYFTVNPFNGDGWFDESYLNALPAIEETTYLRHVRFERPAIIKMDGKKSLGVILK